MSWVRVDIAAVAGSAPREVGAEMYVSPSEQIGTIGGGALEYRAIHSARTMLRNGQDQTRLEIPLGPEIGQCCGGRVTLRLTRCPAPQPVNRPVPAAHPLHLPIRIFGAGHVGLALCRILQGSRDLMVIDSRAAWLDAMPNGISARLSVLPEAEIAAAPKGSAFVILTHDHGLDFLLAEAALTRRDAAYVGMIGSASKRAALRHRLKSVSVGDRGLTCPIGATAKGDKRPEAIAAATASELARVAAGLEPAL